MIKIAKNNKIVSTSDFRTEFELLSRNFNRNISTYRSLIFPPTFYRYPFVP